jgi:hypothetical protein
MENRKNHYKKHDLVIPILLPPKSYKFLAFQTYTTNQITFNHNPPKNKLLLLPLESIEAKD